jgi:FlaG/FlaF family flagellin (archaellin)
MEPNNLKTSIRKSFPKKRRAGAEVIASLLLVAITVVGAVILTTFLDESFIAGGVAASGSDETIKTIKLLKYDSRDGGDLLTLSDLNNTSIAPSDGSLCRVSCNSNQLPKDGGTDFLIIQIENQSLNPIFLDAILLDNVTHSWDGSTADVIFEPLITVNLPGDGKFSILPTDVDIGITKQNIDNQIPSGGEVNLLIKLDVENPDIPLGKTLRAQFNIGDAHLSEFLIESGGAQ